MTTREHSCILHLGTAKTGTTALQFGLAGYDDGKTAYATFPTSPDNPNHSEPLVFAGLSQADIHKCIELYPRWQADGNKMRWANSAALKHMLMNGAPPDIKTYHAALESSISNRPDRRLIYSGELLFSNYNSATGLISSLRGRFQGIEGIVYLRPCAGAFLSRFQQRLTTPSPMAFFSDGLRQDLENLTFRDAEYLGRWKEALRDENLQIAIYARDALKNGDIIDDFCARTGLDATRAHRTRTNVSFSAEATAVLAAMSFYGEMPSNRGVFVRNKRYFDVLMSQYGDGKLGLSDAFADRLHNANKEALDQIDGECGQDFVRRYSKASHLISQHSDLLQIYRDILPELSDFLAINAGRKFAHLPRNPEDCAKKICQLLSTKDPFSRRRLPPSFDAAQYLLLNPDIARAGVDAKKHFLAHGCFEGRFY